MTSGAIFNLCGKCVDFCPNNAREHVGRNITSNELIKEINDDNDHIEKTIKLLSIINVEQVNLLPYHKIEMDKYRRLKMNYKLSGMEKPSDERMEKISQKFKKAGIKIKIGG